MKGLRVGLGLLAAALFAGLAVIAPKGLPDGRVFGYTATEIDQWALNAQAVELAMGPVYLLDLFLPAVLASFLLTVLPRWALWLPIVYAAVDYRENALLQSYYDGLGAALPLSHWASTLTQTKWATLFAVLCVVLWGGLRSWRRA